MSSSSKKIKELVKEKIRTHRADVNIGKKGIYEGLINEIKRRLKQQQVVKVRILRSARKVFNSDRHEIAKRVAELTNSQLISVRGFTFILRKKKG